MDMGGMSQKDVYILVQRLSINLITVKLGLEKNAYFYNYKLDCH